MEVQKMDIREELSTSNVDEIKEIPTSIQLYLKEIAEYPILTADEEQELAKKIEMGDKQAKEKFINSNLRLVVSVAKDYQTEKIELLDLIQEGNLGLITQRDLDLVHMLNGGLNNQYYGP